MPAVERELERFRRARTQVLGVSVDSIHCHANWARSLGGVSFPLLADFHPKGAVASSFGLYLEDAGITDRASVLIDDGGTVRWSESVTPAGQRDVLELAAVCEKLAGAGSGPALPSGAGVPADTVVYVKNHCGASQRVLLALDNLHLRDRVAVRNVSDDAAAQVELKRVGGREQAPCLSCPQELLFESDAILRWLAERAAPLPGA